MFQGITLRASTPRYDDVMSSGFFAWTPWSPFAFGELSSRLVESHDRVVLTVDVPGVHPDDVRIEAVAGGLSVCATRQRGDTSTHLGRTFSLPTAVDTERASACLEDGVLTVVLPKLAPRRIPIRLSAGTEKAGRNAVAKLWGWLRGLLRPPGESRVPSPGVGAPRELPVASTCPSVR